MKNSDEIILFRGKDVATITLNRPKVLNALSLPLINELRKALAIVAKDKRIRTLILNGAGTSFCAGGDIKQDLGQVSKMPPHLYKAYIEQFFRAINNIVCMKKPVIAAIKGYAIGGGLELAMVCDIRIAAIGAKLGNAYVRMGIIPDIGGIHLLSRLIGAGNAKLLLFTGDFITAQEAYRIGLVEKVVPEDELDNSARELAEKLAHGPTKAIAMTKMALNRSTNFDLKASTEYCQKVAFKLFQTEDHKEAVRAYLQKREPLFKGK